MFSQNFLFLKIFYLQIFPSRSWFDPTVESEVKLFTKLSVSRPSDAGVMYGLMMCHGNTILYPQLSARSQTVLHRKYSPHTHTAQHNTPTRVSTAPISLLSLPSNLKHSGFPPGPRIHYFLVREDTDLQWLGVCRTFNRKVYSVRSLFKK